MRERVLTVLGILCLCTASLRADEIVLRSGKKLRGYAVRRGQEILVNEFGCGAPEMTRGVQRLRAVDVREIVSDPIQAHLQAVLTELGPRDVDRRLELMRLAESRRARAWAARLAAEILRVRPGNAEALKAIGGEEEWQALRRGNPTLDSRLAGEVRRLLRTESGAARRAFAERLEREYGYAPGADCIERMVRSRRRARGLHERIDLRMHARDHPGGHYALVVPEDYDATEPRPLLVALHGGGMLATPKGEVRGSPKDALALYQEGAKRLGWFLVCPAALEAPWSSTRNVQFLQAVLEEVTTLWNIDLERIHLAGMGGGADGVWAWAARDADAFATVSVACSGKPSGASAVAARTALWMYQGEADELRDVEPVRKTAERLARRKLDFAYCELPKEGHGFPPAARRDLFRFIAPRRRQRAGDAWPRASFARPPSKEAVRTFGAPEAAWGIGLSDDLTAAELVDHVRAGRTDAEPAARRLAETFAPARDSLSEDVRAIVRDRKAPRAARLWATWLCGAWKDPLAVNELGNVLRTGKDARLLRLAAEAVGRVGSPDNAQDLRWALDDVGARYRSLQGRTVAFHDFARVCALGAAVVEAIGLCVKEPDEFLPEIEETLVRHVLMDRRPVTYALEHGENPSRPRGELAEAIARAYHRLGAEKTLFDMLLLAVRGDVAATSAVRRGMR